MEGCAGHEKARRKACYRADSYEVAWWSTRLLEVKAPAEALYMWLSVRLHKEYLGMLLLKMFL